MSLKTFIAKILHPTSGSVIGQIELSVVDHAIAIAKADTGLVGKVEAQIAAAKTDASLTTGAAKLAYVVEAAVPDVLEIVADPAKAASDVEDFAIQLVQSVYNDVASASAGAIASIIVAKATPAATA